MVTEKTSIADVLKALAEVKDPEIPVLSIVDLGIVHSIQISGTTVGVELTPTFLGCPALDAMSEQVKARLLSMGFQHVEVKKTFGAPWSTDVLKGDARQRLEEYGIAPPIPTSEVAHDNPIACPFCRSTDTRIEGRFGATLCRQLCYCNACKQSFEKFKTI